MVTFPREASPIPPPRRHQPLESSRHVRGLTSMICSCVRTVFQIRISSITPKKSCGPYSRHELWSRAPVPPVIESKQPPIQSCSRPSTRVPPEGSSLPFPRVTDHTCQDPPPSGHTTYDCGVGSDTSVQEPGVAWTCHNPAASFQLLGQFGGLVRCLFGKPTMSAPCGAFFCSERFTKVCLQCVPCEATKDASQRQPLPAL